MAAEKPTRETERPTFTAGRTPELNRSVSKKDLPVGDGDDVGRNVGRDVAGLGLNDRQRGERTAALFLAHLGRALEQAGVEIEDVARIGFAARRTAQQQRNFAVGHGVLGEIVVHDQGVLAVVAEVLADGGGGVGREVEHGRGLGGRGGHDDGVAHGAGFGERLHHLGDRRALLADGAVDADQIVLGVVDDGVEQDGGLAGLAVADDQLALAAADRDHGVDGLEAGGHGLAHALAVDDAGGQALDGQRLRGGDGALVVDGLAQRVDHAADHGLADGHGENLAGALDLVAFAELGVVAEDDGADLVFFKREGEARDAVREG